MGMAPFVRERVPWAISSTEVAYIYIFFFPATFKKFAWYRKIWEMNHCCTLNEWEHLHIKMFFPLSDSPIVHSLVFTNHGYLKVFCSFAQKHNMSVLPRWTLHILPIIWLSPSHPGQSKATVDFPQLPVKNGIARCLSEHSFGSRLLLERCCPAWTVSENFYLLWC